METIGRCCQNAYTYPVNRQKAIIGGSIAGFIIVVILAIIFINSGSENIPETNVQGSYALKKAPLIIGVNNIARNLKLHRKNRINDFNFSNCTKDEKWTSICKQCVTDLESLKYGMVATQVFTIEVPCKAIYNDAVALTLEQIDVMQRLLAQTKIGLAKTTEDIKIAHRSSKLSAMLGLKGGHMIDSRLPVLRMYYESGVRIMSLTSGCDTPWARYHAVRENDTDTGLNEFGKKVISEMNRLGMIVDASQSSKKTQLDAISNSDSPVIFTNVGACDKVNVSKNLEGDVLEKIKKRNGLIMISFDPKLIKIGDKTNVSDFIEHLDYLREKVGEDCLGIGGNFDGFEKKIIGLESTKDIPKLFNSLKDKGWTIEQLEKLAGMNFIRIIKTVQEEAEKLSKAKSPLEDYEEEKDFKNISCYSDWKERY